MIVKHVAIPALAVAALASVAACQPPPGEPQPSNPEAVINGPKTGQPGDIVILDGSSSTNATGFAWLVETDAIVPEEVTVETMRIWARHMKAAGWTAQEPENPTKPLWLLSSDGKSVMLASYPGTYRVSLAVGNLETDVPSMTYHIFESISERGPPPPPIDDPDDDPPDDDPPPITFDLEDKAAGWAADVTDHRERLRELGRTFEQIGNSHAGLGSKDAIDGLITFAIQMNFTKELPAWVNLFEKLDRSLDAVRDVATTQQYGEAVASVGRGIQR